MLKTKSKITYHKPRYGDQERFVNELKKIKNYSNWEPKISIEEGLKDILIGSSKIKRNEKAL